MLQSKEIIGRLDKRITIKSITSSIDVSNANAETGTQDEVSVWAKVDYRRGSEITDGDQIKPVQDLLFTIRTRTINSGWIISYEGKFYEIDSIEKPDRRYMIIGAFYRQDYV